MNKKSLIKKLFVKIRKIDEPKEKYPEMDTPIMCELSCFKNAVSYKYLITISLLFIFAFYYGTH